MKVSAEKNIKVGSEISHILGEIWHVLPEARKAYYLRLEADEKKEHVEMYPGWTPSQKYGLKSKKPRTDCKKS